MIIISFEYKTFRYYGKGVETSEARHFAELFREGSMLCGAGNPGDFLPMFKRLHPIAVVRR